MSKRPLLCLTTAWLKAAKTRQPKITEIYREVETPEPQIINPWFHKDNFNTTVSEKPVHQPRVQSRREPPLK